MRPLMTIGLPVYRSMPYLPETMESIFAQRFENFEILAIVDDCTDGSVEYMESLRDPRLRIIRQPKGGLVPALNLMLQKANSPWLVRQDSDDVAYPQRLERIACAIEEHPDAGMFYSLAEYFPKENSLGLFRCTRGRPEELRRIAYAGKLLSICHPTAVLNIEKTLAVGGYDQTLHVEDADLWVRMAMHAPIYFIPEILLGYRHNAASLTSHNLQRAQIGLLYVQYLHISRLHKLPPQPLESIQTLLAALTSEQQLRAKEHLRSVNMMMAERRHWRAFLFALRSFCASPHYFFSRIRDEFISTHPITNGIDPKIFLRRRHEFWPD